MHEQSETIQDKAGRWLNVFGKNTMSGGKPIKKKYDFEKDTYDTVDEAVAAAKKRSEEEGKDLQRSRKPRSPRSQQQQEYDASQD